MRFANWVYETEKDMDLVEAIVIDLLRRRPANPYAYYAPGGEARRGVTGKAHSERLERESAAFKRQT
jgi:hypothetical protein